MVALTLCYRLRVVWFAILLFGDFAKAGSSIVDFEAAKQLAKKENKDIILSFSGYRWWSEVNGFNTETEDPWIRGHFIMLEVEIPRDLEDTGGVITAEEQSLVDLREMFHQDLYEPGPAIFLLDASGRPYAEVDSNEQGDDIYIPEFKRAIESRVKRDAAFESARNVNGIEKAKLLNTGLRALYEVMDDGELVRYLRHEVMVGDYYQDIFAEIIKNDTKDVLGRGQELRDRKQYDKEVAEYRLVDEQFKSLVKELNRMLEGPAPLAAYSSKIDKFIEAHPALSKEARQRALFGKVEAAVILRDYNSALQSLEVLVLTTPDLPLTKNLTALLKPKLEKAIELSAAGTDRAATHYAFRLDLSHLESLLDPDGSNSKAALEQITKDRPPMLAEDEMWSILNQVDKLIYLRKYEEALRKLDRFVGLGGSSRQVRHRDRERRPAILRGLNRK
jgi:hypothetical protein